MEKRSQQSTRKDAISLRKCISTTIHLIWMGVVALSLYWRQTFRRWVGCLASARRRFATNRNKKQWQRNKKGLEKHWSLLPQSLGYNNSTTNSALAVIVVSIVKSDEWALFSAKNQAKRTSRTEVIADGRSDPKINLVLSSCFEMGKRTQQPAWVGQDRSSSSTIFNHLSTGAN